MPETAQVFMTPLGWTFMAAFWGFILVLTTYCFWLVLAEQPKAGPASNAAVEPGLNKSGA